MSANARRISIVARTERAPHLSLHFDHDLLQTWFNDYLKTLDTAAAAGTASAPRVGRAPAPRFSLPPGPTRPLRLTRPAPLQQQQTRVVSAPPAALLPKSKAVRRQRYLSPPPPPRGKYIPLTTMYRKKGKKMAAAPSAPAAFSTSDNGRTHAPMPPIPPEVRESVLRAARARAATAAGQAAKPLPPPAAVDDGASAKSWAPGVRRVRTPVGAGLRRSGLHSLPPRPASPAPSARWHALGSPRLRAEIEIPASTARSTKRQSWKRRSLQKFRSLQKLTHAVRSPTPSVSSSSAESSSRDSRRETAVIPLDSPQSDQSSSPEASLHHFAPGTPPAVQRGVQPPRALVAAPMPAPPALTGPQIGAISLPRQSRASVASTTSGHARRNPPLVRSDTVPGVQFAPKTAPKPTTSRAATAPIAPATASRAATAPMASATASRAATARMAPVTAYMTPSRPAPAPPNAPRASDRVSVAATAPAVTAETTTTAPSTDEPSTPASQPASEAASEPASEPTTPATPAPPPSLAGTASPTSAQSSPRSSPPTSPPGSSLPTSASESGPDSPSAVRRAKPRGARNPPSPKSVRPTPSILPWLVDEPESMETAPARNDAPTPPPLPRRQSSLTHAKPIPPRQQPQRSHTVPTPAPVPWPAPVLVPLHPLPPTPPVPRRSSRRVPPPPSRPPMVAPPAPPTQAPQFNPPPPPGAPPRFRPSLPSQAVRGSYTPPPPPRSGMRVSRSAAEGLAHARELERKPKHAPMRPRPPSAVAQLPVCRVPTAPPLLTEQSPGDSPHRNSLPGIGATGERYPALIPRAAPTPALVTAVSTQPKLTVHPSPARPATIVHGAPATSPGVHFARILSPRVRSITPIVQVTPPTPPPGGPGAPRPATTIVPPLPRTTPRAVSMPSPLVVPLSLVAFHRQATKPNLAAGDYQFDMEVARAAGHSIDRLHCPTKEVHLGLLLMFFSMHAMALFWNEWVEPNLTPKAPGVAARASAPSGIPAPNAADKPFTALSAIRALPDLLPAPTFLIGLLTRFRVDREASYAACITANGWERPCLAAGEDWSTELFRGMIAHLESTICRHLYGDIRKASGVRLKAEHRLARREYEIIHHLSRRIKPDAPRTLALEDTWFAFLFKEVRPRAQIPSDNNDEQDTQTTTKRSRRRIRFWSKDNEAAPDVPSKDASDAARAEHGRHVVVGHLTGLMVKHPSFDDMTAITLYANYGCELTLKATREFKQGATASKPVDEAGELIGGGHGTVNGTTMLFLGAVALRDYQACVKLLNMPKTSVLIRNDLARAGLVAFVGPRSLATILTVWANEIVHKRGSPSRYSAFAALLSTCLVQANASVVGGPVIATPQIPQNGPAAGRPANSALAHAFDLFKLFNGINENPAALHVTGFLYGMALAAGAKHVLQTYMSRHPLPRKFDWALLAALVPHNTAYLQKSGDLSISTWRAMYTTGGIREDQIEQAAARDLLAHMRLLRAHYEADMDRLKGPPVAVATLRNQAVAMWTYLLCTLGSMFALPVPCEFTPPVVVGARHATCSAFSWRPAKDTPFHDNLAAAHIGLAKQQGE